MTNATSPIKAMFEMHRQSITHGRQQVKHGLELQQNEVKMVLTTGLATQQSAQRQGIEFTRQFVDTQLDAFGSALDEDDSCLTFDQQFEEIDRVQEETWNEVEIASTEMVDNLFDQQKALFAKSVDSILDVQQEVEQQTVESVQQATEEITDETSAAIENAATQGSEAAQKSLEALEGVGTTYTERLTTAGIETVDELAAAQAEAVAEAAEISADRAENWIEAAQSQPQQ